MFKDVLNAVKGSGWIVAAIFFAVAIFRDAIKDGLRKALNFAGEFLYQKLAGSRLLRRKALKNYRKGLVNSTAKIQVPFRPNRPLILDDIYIVLRAGAEDSQRPKDAWDLLKEDRRIVVTGPPGAGKSMLLRHLAAASCEQGSGYRGSSKYIPVLLELHRFARPAQGGTSIEAYLVDAFERYGFPKADKFLKVALEKNWLLLLFDGLDEVPSDERGEVAARVRDFLERKRSCPAVVTCRSAVYRGELDSVCEQQVELEPFEDQQIEMFLDSWTDPMPAGKSSAQLMAALREQPQLLGAARNPLLLTIITHLYSDNPTYVLPRSRAEFYRQAAAILLEQWQGHLGHNEFDGAEKRTVLSGLALRMQDGADGKVQDRRTISREAALAAAADIMPRIGRDSTQVGSILREIVERSGLLLGIDGNTRYAFAHLTFQEYFASEALLGRPDYLLERFEADTDAWREVVILWCGLVADSTSMVEKVKAVADDVGLACVAEARSIDEALANEILGPVIDSVTSGEASEAVQKGLGAVAADVRPRGTKVLMKLVDALRADGTGDARQALGNALAASNRSEAAEAIVSKLEDSPDLASCAVRLGDLAVPSLRRVAAFDQARVACGCLADIATPNAGVALVATMISPGEPKYAAAWGVSKVVGNPLVANALSKDLRFRRTKHSSGKEWIWRPFSDHDNVVLPWVVGLAAELIERSSLVEDAIAVPDVRISTALCAADASPLRESLRPSDPAVKRTVAAINHLCESEIISRGKDGGLVSDYREAGPMVASDRIRFSRGPGPVESYGDLLLATSGWFNYDILRARRQTERAERGSRTGADIEASLDAVGDAVLSGIGDDRVWTRLVRGMPLAKRWAFLVRVSRGGRVREDNWSEVTARDPFRFATSAWYGGVLGLLLGTSALACFAAVGQIIGGAELWMSLIAGLCCAAIVFTWVRMRDESIGKAIGGIDPDELALALVAPLVLVVEPSDIPDEPGLLAVGLFAPGCCWLLGSALADRVGLWGAVSAILWLLILGATFTLIGTRKERARAMPLAGFFVGGVASQDDLSGV
jgi:hypothetical protein